MAEGRLTSIRGVPTSLGAEAEARSLGIELLPENAGAPIDIVIDGADEIAQGWI
jgi:ribose 5-phosphate isomerase